MDSPSNESPGGTSADNREQRGSTGIIFVFVALLVIAAAVVAAIVRPAALTALVLIPTWCWLLVGLLSAISVYRAGQRVIAISLVAGWTLFAVVWVEEVAAFGRLAFKQVYAGSSPPGQRLRIVSLNGANTDRCLWDLKQSNPDIVLLQEAPASDALAEMAEALFDGNGSYVTNGDAAILARGAVTDAYVNNPRFVAGRIRLNDGQELYCACLRLAPPISRLDFWRTGFWSDHQAASDGRRQELRAILEHLRERSGSIPVVVGGDFNTTPLDRCLDELRPPLRDAFDSAGIGWGATGTNELPIFRVDQVWTSSRIVPAEVRAVKTEHSDHRMVVCEVVVVP
jgi:hypothetical protein